MPVLALASGDPKPGMDCVIIGHPASGMLWTLRSGQVAAVGTAPTDLIDIVMARLAAAPGERASVDAALRAAPTFDIFLSSAGQTPGTREDPF
jgi:hypothetical protein